MPSKIIRVRRSAKQRQADIARSNADYLGDPVILTAASIAAELPYEPMQFGPIVYYVPINNRVDQPTPRRQHQPTRVDGKPVNYSAITSATPIAVANVENYRLVSDYKPILDESMPEPGRVLTPAELAAIAGGLPASAPATASERALARAAARKACESFYISPLAKHRTSVPFKFRGDLKRLSPVNYSTGAEITARTAGAIALILAYCDVSPNGDFVRGSGKMPGSLLGQSGIDRDRVFATGPESGVLSQLIGAKRVEYVSGTLHGADAESAVFRLHFANCRKTLTTFNDKLESGEHRYSSSLGLLDLIESMPAPSELATAPESSPVA